MGHNAIPFLDEIGVWSEIKLEIIEKYARAYSIIMNNYNFEYYYIDAFSGAGHHKSKTKNEVIDGSPKRAIDVEPQFSHYYFIDLEKKKTDYLASILGSLDNVTLKEGDCNDILTKDVFPNVKYNEYKRALCLLDPYGLHLDWDVIKMAGELESIELFLNFPVMNMNALWKNPDNVKPVQLERMNRYWGDDSWKDVVYDDLNLFKYSEKVVDANNKIAIAFRDRLKKVAGFNYVPKPMTMKNSTNATVYYLFFASPNRIADKIVNEIFNKYKDQYL